MQHGKPSLNDEEKLSNPLKLNVVNVLKVPVSDPKDQDQDQSKRVQLVRENSSLLNELMTPAEEEEGITSECVIHAR